MDRLHKTLKGVDYNDDNDDNDDKIGVDKHDKNR